MAQFSKSQGGFCICYAFNGFIRKFFRPMTPSNLQKWLRLSHPYKSTAENFVPFQDGRQCLSFPKNVSGGALFKLATSFWVYLKRSNIFWVVSQRGQSIITIGLGQWMLNWMLLLCCAVFLASYRGYQLWNYSSVNADESWGCSHLVNKWTIFRKMVTKIFFHPYRILREEIILGFLVIIKDERRNYMHIPYFYLW